MSFIHSAYWVASALSAQRMPRRALDALRLARLKRMLAHCWREVPFYRELWSAAGVRPDDVSSLADLRRFPIPDRRALEREPERVVAAPFLDLYRAGAATVRRSGGSSGGPQLEVHADPGSWRRLDGFYFRALHALGYRPLSPIAYFWGAPFASRGFNRVGLMPKVGVPAHMDEDGQILILEQNPGIWWYYHPTSLFALARRFGERLRATRPRRVVSHAELLPSSMRTEIERVLGVPVYDQYGTSEFNRMAWECTERSGYHVDADSVVLEVLDDDDRPVRPGEVGRAVVTGLMNRMMPLVRYELGDLVVASDRRCACGRTLPMIERIEGRVKDAVILPGGGRRTPREVLEPFAPIEGIEQYRVVFEATDRARLDYVTSRAETGAIERAIRRRFEDTCPGVSLAVERIDAIEKAPTGKRVMIRNQARPASRAGRAVFVE